MSRQSHYESRIRHLVNEIRNKDSEIERLSAALHLNAEQQVNQSIPDSSVGKDLFSSAG